MKGPREKLLYVVTVQPNLDEPHGDYLSTVDVDPESPTYCQIIHRTFTNKKGMELHHSGKIYHGTSIISITVTIVEVSYEDYYKISLFYSKPSLNKYMILILLTSKTN